MKKFLLFFSSSIRMSGKNIIFDDEKINESNFYKNKKLSKIDDIDVNKIIISKKESYGKKEVHLNTSLDKVMMMSLDHNVYSFLK